MSLVCHFKTKKKAFSFDGTFCVGVDQIDSRGVKAKLSCLLRQCVIDQILVESSWNY